MSEEAEVVSQGKEGILMDPVSAFIVKVRKYPPVFPEQSVNISHEIVCITVQPVVVVVPALIRAEFLIGATTNGVATIETFLFHSTNVLIKIQKNVFKRLQTTINDLQADIIAYVPI